MVPPSRRRPIGPLSVRGKANNEIILTRKVHKPGHSTLNNTANQDATPKNSANNMAGGPSSKPAASGATLKANPAASTSAAATQKRSIHDYSFNELKRMTASELTTIPIAKERNDTSLAAQIGRGDPKLFTGTLKSYIKVYGSDGQAMYWKALFNDVRKFEDSLLYAQRLQLQKVKKEIMRQIGAVVGVLPIYQVNLPREMGKQKWIPSPRKDIWESRNDGFLRLIKCRKCSPEYRSCCLHCSERPQGPKSLGWVAQNGWEEWDYGAGWGRKVVLYHMLEEVKVPGLERFRQRRKAIKEGCSMQELKKKLVKSKLGMEVQEREKEIGEAKVKAKGKKKKNKHTLGGESIAKS